MLKSFAPVSANKDPVLITELRRQFANAYRPRPWIYWSDFLISAGLGWGAFVIGGNAALFSFTYLLTTLIALIALLRAAIFIHELSHLKRGTIPGFEIAWNLIVGIPFLLPSVMYDSHGDHHRQSTFGTTQDPEYAPIAHWHSVWVFGFVLSTVAVPALLALRWGLLGPLGFFIPPLRRFLITRASALVINPQYRKPFPQQREVLRWQLQEIATGMAFWGAIVSFTTGTVSWLWLWHWYIVGTGILLINQVRTLAAHRYINDGQQLTVIEQLLDSINLTGRPWLTVLAAPVGLRYHALHHILPTVPYHSLGTLHRQLCTMLPANSPYRQTEERGILAGVRILLSHPLANRTAPVFTADRPATEV